MKTKFRIIYNHFEDQHYIQYLTMRKKYRLFGELVPIWNYITQRDEDSLYDSFPNPSTLERATFYEFSTARAYLRDLEQGLQEDEIKFETEF